MLQGKEFITSLGRKQANASPVSLILQAPGKQFIIKNFIRRYFANYE